MPSFMDFLSNPAVVSGLSVLANNKRPAEGLLQGSLLQNRLQAGKANIANQKLQGQLAQQQILRAQQDASARKARDKLFSDFRGSAGQEVAGPQLPGSAGLLRAGGSGALGATSPGGEQITQAELAQFANVLAANPETTQQGISLLQSLPQPRPSKLLTDDEFQQQLQLRTAGRPITQIGGKPLSINDLGSMVDRNDNPLGADALLKTREELALEGAKVQTAGTRTRQADIKRAQATLGTLQKLANPVFTGTAGAVNRTFDDAVKTWDRIGQTDKDLALYEAFSQGTMASLIRAVGEKGNMSNKDIERGLGLVPNTGKGLIELPDTREVAQGKMKQLREWFDSALGESQQSGGSRPPAGGKVIRFDAQGNRL